MPSVVQRSNQISSDLFEQSPCVYVVHVAQLITSCCLAIISLFSTPHLKKLDFLLAHKMADQTGSTGTRFQELFDSTLHAYEKVTGVTLANHRLAVELQHCDTIEGITALLQDQAKGFKKSEEIIKSVETIISILTPLSSAASLPDIVGLVCYKVLATSFTSDIFSQPFPPAKAIQACLGVLLDVCAVF